MPKKITAKKSKTPSRPSVRKKPVAKKSSTVSKQPAKAKQTQPVPRVITHTKPVRIVLKPAGFEFKRTANVGVGKGQRASGTGHAGHKDRYVISMVLEGELEIVIDDIPHQVKAGEAILMKPGHREFFKFKGQGFSVHSWFVVRQAAMPVDLVNRLSALKNPVKVPISDHLRWMSELVLLCPEPISETAQASFERQAFSLYYEFLRILEQTDGLPAQSAHNITKIVNYLHDNLGETIDLETVARAVNITPHHIIRLFRQHLGDTPMRYLWNLRTRRGSDLLRHTSLSVSEIAYEVGFQSPFHFSRVIKEKYGMSPKSYRIQHQNQTPVAPEEGA